MSSKALSKAVRSRAFAKARRRRAEALSKADRNPSISIRAAAQAVDEAAALAICRDAVAGEVVESSGKVGRRGAVAAPTRRTLPWIVHEMRDGGLLSRDLVETAERFSALHLQLEPRSQSALLGDGVRGGAIGPHERLLRRSALAEHVDRLYSIVAKKLSPTKLAIFAMAFDPMRPSTADVCGACGLSIYDVCGIVETGLSKLWAAEPITFDTERINENFRGVNDLERFARL